MDDNVKFVPKEINPPNVPQSRSIENVWVYLAQRFTRKSWMLKQQLIHHIEFKMKEFDTNFLESVLEGIKAKVEYIGDNGLYALFKF